MKLRVDCVGRRPRRAGRPVRLCAVLMFSKKISDPTAKWNSSISFLSRYKAESEPSLLGALVTEGKCIKEVKNMSGWSVAKAPHPLAPSHLVPLIRKLLGVKKHRVGVCIYGEIWQRCLWEALGREAGLSGAGGERRNALSSKTQHPESWCGKR